MTTVVVRWYQLLYIAFTFFAAYLNVKETEHSICKECASLHGYTWCKNGNTYDIIQNDVRPDNCCQCLLLTNSLRKYSEITVTLRHSDKMLSSNSVIACFTILRSVKAISEPVVELDEGPICGKVSYSWLNNQYYVFEGIPYAEPPVGLLRYKDPVPVQSWTEVKSAKAKGSKCLQYTQVPLPEFVSIDGEEDCLFLNVYTPRLVNNPDEFFEVVVFIHGGSFMFGSGNDYGPEYYMDKELVFVTIQYRLGVFGFLYSGDSALPANLGLKDQVLALQWIRNNIEKFGGNKDKVTITGHSAGGASVSYHMLSPKSKGLFSKAVSFSGTALDPWAIAEDIPAKTMRIAEVFGCSKESSFEMVDCLREVPAFDILNTTGMFFEWLYNPFSPFAPVVEEESPTAFITRHPVDILKSGEAYTVPWITSVTTEDALYPVAQFISYDEYLEELNDEYLRIFPSLMFYDYTVEYFRQDNVSKEIRKKYFGNQDISQETRQQLIKMMTNRIFDLGDQLMAELYSEYTNASVYFYQFGYRGLHSFSEFFSGTNIDYGVAHGDDICYLMTCPFFNASETEEDRNMIRLMVDIFSSFYKTGKPEVPSNLNTDWIPIEGNENSEDFEILFFKSPEELYMFSDDDIGNRTFWSSLDIHENEGLW